MQAPSTTRNRLFIRPLERAAVFAVVWWVVAEADPEGWLFGVPFVMLATFASLKLTPTRSWRIRPLGALRYAGYFAHQSILGGIDVALRAIRPSMPLDPELVEYRMRLEPEHARVLFADTVSLLPGTLSTGFEGDWLTMHVLDCGLPVEQSLRDVEERVADLFGLDLAGGESDFCTCGSRYRVDGEDS
jgi:multicomponent Na+:H+ antiporter subunit E